MTKETDALLHHADVVRVIAAILRMTGIRGHLLEDEIANVQEKAWRATEGDRPDSIERWKKIVRPVAKAHGITELRKRVARAKRNTGPTGDADDHAKNADIRPRWDLHDADKALKLLWLMLDDGTIPRDFEIYLDAIQAGESQEKIATEAGMTHAAFRKQLMKVRAAFLARGAPIGIAALATLVVLMFLREKIERNTIAHDKPVPAHVDAGPEAPAPQVLVDTRAAELDALRAKAEAAARQDEWQECHDIYRQMDRIQRSMNDASVPMTPTRQTCEEQFLKLFDSKDGRKPKEE